MDISASDFCGDGDPAVDKKRDLCPEADLLYLAGERHVFLVAKITLPEDQSAGLQPDHLPDLCQKISLADTAVSDGNHFIIGMHKGGPLLNWPAAGRQTCIRLSTG